MITRADVVVHNGKPCISDGGLLPHVSSNLHEIGLLMGKRDLPFLVEADILAIVFKSVKWSVSTAGPLTGASLTWHCQLEALGRPHLSACRPASNNEQGRSARHVRAAIP